MTPAREAEARKQSGAGLKAPPTVSEGALYKSVVLVPKRLAASMIKQSAEERIALLTLALAEESGHLRVALKRAEQAEDALAQQREELARVKAELAALRKSAEIHSCGVSVVAQCAVHGQLVPPTGPYLLISEVLPGVGHTGASR